MAKKPVKFAAKRNSGSGNARLKELYSMGEVMEVPLDKWKRDETQPRPHEEVMEGIEEFADQLERDDFKLAQYPVYHIEEDGSFLNVVGERRTTSFILKGRETIHAVCRKFTEVERREIFLLQYIENDDKEKKPLSPLADARAWRRLIDDYYDGNLTQAAKMRGRSKGEVSNRLSLLKAADEVVEYIQKNNITDPATYAALGRLWKHSANKAKELMEQHESGELKGSFRSALEECSKAFSKKKAGQGACDPNDFGGGESGSEEANQTLDLLVTNATEKTLKNIAKAAKILAKANETAVDGQSSDEIMIKELSKAMNAIKSAINDYKKGK